MADTKRKYEAKETTAVGNKAQKIDGKEELKGGLTTMTPTAIGTFTTNPAFLTAMMHTPVETLKPVSNVILVAQRTDLLVEVWKGLVRNNFLSCPVLQKTKQKYYGFIDMHDIVDFVIKKFDTNKLESAKDFWGLMEADKELMATTVNAVMKYPVRIRNPYHPVSVGYSLFSAVELLAREPGLHRVPVIDSERNLKSLLTQSQVVDFIMGNMELLGGIRQKPIEEVATSKKTVLSVTLNTTAIEAFRMMAEHNITGLAVVDDNGRLVDALTLKDLKAISTDGQMFWRLYQQVRVFLEKVRQETVASQRPDRLIYCLKNQTFEHVIRTMCNNKIHRVFLIDSVESMKPIGIITMKDVLFEIINS